MKSKAERDAENKFEIDVDALYRALARSPEDSECVLRAFARWMLSAPSAASTNALAGACHGPAQRAKDRLPGLAIHAISGESTR